MRYIQESDLSAYLASGRTVENLLSSSSINGLAIVRFVRIDKEKSGRFSAAKFEIFDQGTPEFLDIYEFSPLDPDLPYGEISLFDTPEDAIKHACEVFGADVGKFVGSGMIQDEYKEKYHADW